MDTKQKFKYWRKRILFTAWITYAMFYLCRVNMAIAIPGITEEFAISKTAMGGVLTALFMMYAIGQFINGALADKIGARRLIAFGILSSAILNIIFSTFKLFENENILLWKPEYTDSTLTQWIVSQIGYYIMIFLIILGLMILMKVLKKTGTLDRLNNFLKPALSFLGMSKNVAILPIIGMTLGLAYGGGLIVKEAKSKFISKKDVFLSLSFMGLSHSLIEDTLLTLAIGASIFGILFSRILFTLLIMIILVKCISLISNKTFEKYLMYK